jgi:hypothetical protein
LDVSTTTSGVLDLVPKNSDLVEFSKKQPPIPAASGDRQRPESIVWAMSTRVRSGFVADAQ